jgi:methionine-gamma-lyase
MSEFNKHPDLSHASLDTRCVHGGVERDEYGSVSPAIYQTSTFAFRDTRHGGECFTDPSKGYIYTRLANPNMAMLERALADLDSGAAAMSFCTGMGALNFLFFALLNSGDHIILSESIYAPTRLVVEKHWSRFGVEYSLVDTADVAALARALRPNTRHIHIETPANPNLRITDISACAEIAHSAGARLSVDSTMISPVLQRPLEHGADIVMHSVTKFLNGHSDALGGVLVFRDKALYEQQFKPYYTFGATMDPHQAWMVQRGLKTLPLRVYKAQENAVAVADYLAAHPKIEKVYYPGLVLHEGSEVHARQASGPGSLISFDVKGGFDAGARLLDSLRLMILAVSLGGVDTLIQHPASMTHVGMTPAQRSEAGIGEGLVRLSIGIEGRDDLIADLEQALQKV